MNILADYDMVDPSTVILSNSTEEKPNEKRIYWEAPTTPNGFVLAYRAKLLKDDDTVR
jgi:hypothetical protein